MKCQNMRGSEQQDQNLQKIRETIIRQDYKFISEPEKLHKKIFKPIQRTPIQEAINSNLDYILLIGLRKQVEKTIKKKFKQYKLHQKLKVYEEVKKAFEDTKESNVSIITDKNSIVQLRSYLKYSWQIVSVYVHIENMLTSQLNESSISSISEQQICNKNNNRQQINAFNNQDDESFSDMQSNLSPDDLKFRKISLLYYNGYELDVLSSHDRSISSTFSQISQVQQLYYPSYPKAQINKNSNAYWNQINLTSLMTYLQEEQPKATSFIKITDNQSKFQSIKYHSFIFFILNNNTNDNLKYNNFQQFEMLLRQIPKQSQNTKVDDMQFQSNSSQQRPVSIIQALKKLYDSKKQRTKQQKIKTVLKMYTEQNAFHKAINKFLKFLYNKPSNTQYLQFALTLIVQSVHALFLSQIPKIVQYIQGSKDKKITLFRGTCLKQKQIFDFRNTKPGNIFQNKSFISTSLCFEKARKFSYKDDMGYKHIIQIIIQSEQIQYYIDHVPQLWQGFCFILQKYSTKPDQQQVLLNALNYFEFVSYKEELIQNQSYIFIIFKYINPIKLLHKFKYINKPVKNDYKNRDTNGNMSGQTMTEWQKQLSIFYENQLASRMMTNDPVEMFAYGRHIKQTQYFKQELQRVMGYLITGISLQQIQKLVEQGFRQEKELYSVQLKKKHDEDQQFDLYKLRSVKAVYLYIQQLISKQQNADMSADKVQYLHNIINKFYKIRSNAQIIKNSYVFSIIMLVFLDINSTNRDQSMITKRINAILNLNFVFFSLGMFWLVYKILNYAVHEIRRVASRLSSNLQFRQQYIRLLSSYVKVQRRLRKTVNKDIQNQIIRVFNIQGNKLTPSTVMKCNSQIDFHQAFQYLLNYVKSTQGTQQIGLLANFYYMCKNKQYRYFTLNKSNPISLRKYNKYSGYYKVNRKQILCNLFGTSDQQCISRIVTNLKTRVRSPKMSQKLKERYKFENSYQMNDDNANEHGIVDMQQLMNCNTNLNYQQLKDKHKQKLYNKFREQYRIHGKERVQSNIAEQSKQQQVTNQILKEFVSTTEDQIASFLCLQIRSQVRKQGIDNEQQNAQNLLEQQQRQKQVEDTLSQETKCQLQLAFRSTEIKRSSDKFAKNFENNVIDYESYNKWKQMMKTILNIQDPRFQQLIICKCSIIVISQCLLKLFKNSLYNKSNRNILSQITWSSFNQDSTQKYIDSPDQEIKQIQNFYTQLQIKFQRVLFGSTQYIQLIYGIYLFHLQYQTLKRQQSSQIQRKKLMGYLDNLRTAFETLQSRAEKKKLQKSQKIIMQRTIKQIYSRLQTNRQQNRASLLSLLEVYARFENYDTDFYQCYKGMFEDSPEEEMIYSKIAEQLNGTSLGRYFSKSIQLLMDNYKDGKDDKINWLILVLINHSKKLCKNQQLRNYPMCDKPKQQFNTHTQQVKHFIITIKQQELKSNIVLVPYLLAVLANILSMTPITNESRENQIRECASLLLKHSVKLKNKNLLLIHQLYSAFVLQKQSDSKVKILANQIKLQMRLFWRMLRQQNQLFKINKYMILSKLDKYINRNHAQLKTKLLDDQQKKRSVRIKVMSLDKLQCYYDNFGHQKIGKH